jgi:hypothetical protein
LISTVSNNGYASSDGTSFSSPIVAGLAALLLTKNPCLGPRQLKDIITATAKKTGGYDYNAISGYPGKSLEFGFGRIRPVEALWEATNFSTTGKDLYMRDRYNDAGRDAGYTWTWDFDQSPDIWIRNTNDGFVYENQVDEDIEYTTSSQKYVYVRIGNKGCSASDGNEILKLYASAAGTSTAWPEGWDGTNWMSLGGQTIGSVTIPVLQPGESIVLEVPWSMTFNANHCVLARIENGGSDNITSYSDLGQEIYYNNNIAMNNIIVVNIYAGKPKPIVDGIEYPYGSFVEVGNQSPVLEGYDLIFRTDPNDMGKSITEEAEVVAYLDDFLWNALQDQIGASADVEVLNADERKIRLLDSLVEFNNIIFPTNQRQQIYVGFNFLTEELTSRMDFTYHVTQKKSEQDSVLGDNWTGGVHFRVSKYDRNPFYASADDRDIKVGEDVTLTADQISEGATYNWYDMDGNLIHSGINFVDNPDSSKSYKLEVVSDVDQFKDYSEVNVVVNRCFINSVSPNPASNLMVIDYLSEDVANATLTLAPTSGIGTIHNFMLNPSSTSHTIDVSSFSSGIYAVSLMCDGELKDSKQIVIE